MKYEKESITSFFYAKTESLFNKVLTTAYSFQLQALAVLMTLKKKNTKIGIYFLVKSVFILTFFLFSFSSYRWLFFFFL